MDKNLINEIHAHLRKSRLSGGHALSHNATICKKYERMRRYPLESLQPLSMSLSDALEKRESSANHPQNPIPFPTLSQLLGSAMKVTPRGRRPYPSGGGYYPIESYFFAFSAEKLPRGVFHYRPDIHTLEFLWGLDDDTSSSHFILDEAKKNVSGLFVLTGSFQKSAHKYNDFAYILGMQEAGHIMQNVALVATALDTPIRPLGGFHDEEIAKILDLDADDEHIVYAATVG